MISIFVIINEQKRKYSLQHIYTFTETISLMVYRKRNFYRIIQLILATGIKCVNWRLSFALIIINYTST